MSNPSSRGSAGTSRASVSAVVGLAVLVLLGLLVIGAAATAEVVGREVLPWTERAVERIRVFGSFEFYAGSELVRPSSDYINALALMAMGSMAVVAASLFDGPSFADRRTRLFFLLVTAGAVSLAGDELLGLHETAGHNLGFLRALPFVERPDDAIFATYPVAGVAFLVAFRDVVTFSRRGLALFGAAVALLLLAAGADIVTSSRVEEVLELSSSAALVTAFYLLATDLMRAHRRGAETG